MSVSVNIEENWFIIQVQWYKLACENICTSSNLICIYYNIMLTYNIYNIMLI